MDSLISVIIPVYNVEPFLKECIDSIISQTYFNLEIILVDDGSTDESGDLCDQYSDMDRRIIVLHQKNMGLSCARNSGIEIANGKYIFFLDSDDYIHPQLIECLYNTLVENRADIAFCAHQSVQEKEKVEFQFINSIADLCIETITGQECIERFHSDDSVDMRVVWNKLYKMEYFKDLRFPAGKVHEDEFVTYKLLYPLEKCSYIKSRLYYYRNRSGSIVNQEFSMNYFDKVEAYYGRMEYFRERNRNLYCRALGKYLTAIAWGIIQLKENFPREKNKVSQLYEEFYLTYRAAVKNNDIALLDRMKCLLFLTNESLYKKWKRKSDEHSRKTQQNLQKNEMQ